MSQLTKKYQPLVHSTKADPVFGLDGVMKTLARLLHYTPTVEKKFRLQARQVFELSQILSELSETQLTEKLQHSQRTLKRRKISEEQITHALANVVEVCTRTLGMRPYEVQIMGALALDKNYIIEMKPGEGKTITAGLAGVLKGWRGLPCHVVTSNDYLAARDAQTLKPLYERCNVRVSAITQEMNDSQRRESYLSDVVYATSKELLADFLRDQMRLQGELDSHQLLIQKFCGEQKNAQNNVMSGLHCAIIDEADSVLGDEATTPLIISVSGQNHLLKKAALITKSIVQKLQPEVHYTLNQRYRDISLTPVGKQVIEDLTHELPAIWRVSLWRDDLVQQALVAREFFIRERHYTIIDDKVIIVDEKTGRLMHGRTWRYGLQQAIEAKENLPLSDPTETRARLSFQRFFRLYATLCGMSGTLHGLENELWHIYGVKVVRIPPRVPSQLQLLPEKIYPSHAEKWAAVITRIREFTLQGRPILVGTRSISDSEKLAQELQGLGLTCNVLNALHHEKEAKIIAGAGEPYAITIATNMAGRGTDILVNDMMSEIGGLHVIATERYESRRIDWQLYGRCGRQGQKGSAEVFLSLEDELITTYCTRYQQIILQKMLKFPVGKKITLFMYHRLQKKAEQVAFLARKSMLQRDIWLSETLSFSSSTSN